MVYNLAGAVAAAAALERRFRVWSDPTHEPWNRNTWKRMATFQTQMA